MNDNAEQLKQLLRFNKDVQESVAKVSKAHSEYLCDFIHEISTPINVITGMAELMESTTLSDTQVNYLKTLLNEGQNLQRFIRRLQEIMAEDYEQQNEPGGR